MLEFQRVTLILFALFSVLTAFFQLKSSMKSGKMQSGNATQDEVQKMNLFARIFAILSALFLVVCISIGIIMK